MSFKRINNITGWAICIIACFVYLSTMEATGSFWDCGEFASSAYKLQIPHPPGAPLFILLGRLFMIPFSDPNQAILGLNRLSAFMSGFTILFLFWSITHFARKIVEKNNGGSKEFTSGQLFTIMAAGVVGSLAYTFSDSFWYSAVESEVYASSSFFTAIVFWAALKWEQAVDIDKQRGLKGNFTPADKWLVLIFYLIGLSVGVHLLCLLTIPAIVMLYYYKRYQVTKWGTFWAFVAGCVITGIVQVPMIQWSIKLAGKFDILFTNSFGAPFFTGFISFFILLGILIYVMIRIAAKKNWNFLRLGMWSFAFILLGFSTYFTTLIRSNADPAIDMFNVDNPVSLVGYLSREQYGDWPILKGQDFTDEPETSFKDTYVKGKEKYELKGKKVLTDYNPSDVHFFPRMWDASNDQGHADYYAGFAGIGKDPKTGKYYDKPTMGDNISFFFQYQLNWMYWRYFMWNFAGKQNDLQGVDMGNVRDGNWLTGISFWDNARLGDQSKMPDTLKHNKANNKLYCLPLILGILGLIYQYKKDKGDTLVTGLLFFFTGIAIVVYLNQAGNQPRERDYAYVGSFYAFAIWIGLGVIYVKELLEKYIKNAAVANYVAGGLCLLAVPVLMANQEWDDHDRSHKTIARDIAKDYLESCAPNAILITFGDNDTYPLWYAQEVQGIRRDIRVINSSLLGTDWYINQLRYAVNKSAPIPVIWTPDQIIGSNRDAIYFFPDLPAAKVDQSQPMDLYTMLKDYAGSDDPKRMYQNGDDFINIYPTKYVKVPVDTNLVRQNGTVNPGDSVVSEVTFTIPRNALVKNETAILNIIAANNWKRPIYFTSPYDDLGFQQYLRTDGLTYRLVPVKNAEVNGEHAYDVMTKKFAFGNANIKGVYYDEVNRQQYNTLRMQYAQVANYLISQDEKEKASQLLEECDKNILQENMPYGMASRGQRQNQISFQFLLATYRAGDTVLAKKITDDLRKDIEQQMVYYSSLDENKQAALTYDMRVNQQLLQQLSGMEEYFRNPQPPSPENVNKTIQNVPVPKREKPAHDATQ